MASSLGISFRYCATRRFRTFAICFHLCNPILHSQLCRRSQFQRKCSTTHVLKLISAMIVSHQIQQLGLAIHRCTKITTATTTPNYDAPPVYSSGPSQPAEAISSIDTNVLPGLPNIDFAKYRIPDSSLSKDQCVVTTTFSSLSSHPKALETFVREQADLPLRPHVTIIGVRGQTIDFNIKISMLRYIVHPTKNWNFVKISPFNQKPSKKSETLGDGLGEWVRRFCKDSYLMKS